MIEGTPCDWDNTYACLYYPNQSSKCDLIRFHGQVNQYYFAGTKFCEFWRICEICEILHPSIK